MPDRRWCVPRLWPSRTVAVLASGPSLTREQVELVRTAGVPAVVVNSTFRLAPWAAVLYAADPEWWDHRDNRDAHQFRGLKVSVSDVRGVLHLRDTGVNGFDPNPAALRTGRNSGYQALHLAMHTGAARILLLGFDFTNKSGSHHHGDHPPGLRSTDEAHFESWRPHFATLLPAALERGVAIVNCTPGSAIECFTFNNLGSELAACAESAAA